MSNARANPCAFVIFGASGDLTRRKLLPALYNLVESGNLPDPFAVLGVARPRIDDSTFRAQMRERVLQAEGEPLEPEKWKRIEDRLHYVSGEFHDPQLFERLKATLEELGANYRLPPNYLFYFAVPPDLFGTIAKGLAAAGLADEKGGWRRVIIEKPFGYDLASSRALNAELSQALREPQIYRIDHYLGKETVQNLLAFRFANGIFEPVWNRRYIDHVQMTVAEEVGVETRGAYYDKAGALRDMVQNHMFQVLTLVAMEPPISFGGENVRDEKVKVLHAVQPFSAEDVRRHVIRAQYDADRHGKFLGYTQEPNVAADSRTETFVAMRLFIDNWRWAGVPFFLRTGKRLPKRASEISVHLKSVPPILFNSDPSGRLDSNVLSIRIQPDEGFAFGINSKVPGPRVHIYPVQMDFHYGSTFGGTSPEAYERLLLDVMAGDATLFMRRDAVEAAWKWVTPILNRWAETGAEPASYPAGEWGPSEADRLIEAAGRRWRQL